MSERGILLEIELLENEYEIELNEVKSLEDLAGNTYLLNESKNIIALNLSRNQISEIKSLENLNSLQTLNLSGNQISEIKSLENLNSLQTLNLSGNQISEIKSLENLSSLQGLYLYNNQISEIKSLENLNSLQTLNLSRNQISEIKSLENLSSLQELNLSRNLISEIKSLENLNSLQTLNLSGNQISEIKSLENLSSLQGLYLYNNQISEIKSLENLNSLQELNLSRNQISEIKSLENLNSLETLNLSSNQISEIKSLENLNSLQGLYLYNNQISEIKSLENLNSLQGLYLYNNQISEIKNLENLNSLETLDLSTNQINKLKNLKNLTSLKRLEIENNQINEIKEICDLIKYLDLEKLIIFNNPFLENITLKLDTSYDNDNLESLKYYIEGIEDSNAIEEYLIKKIMFVGNHHSGKTTFLENFLGIPNSKKSTHILNITPYPKNRNLTELEAMIYDFGGQDYYHGLYKAFMNNHATNLIFWKKNTDNNSLSKDNSSRVNLTQNFSTSYWIKQLSNFNKKEDLLNKQWLIQTHIDDDGISFFTDENLTSNIYKQFHINTEDSNCLDFKFLKDCLIEEIKERNKEKKLPFDKKIEEYAFSSTLSASRRLRTIQRNLNIKNLDRTRYVFDQLEKQGLVLYYPNIPAISDVVWLNPSKTISKIHKEIFSEESISRYKGKVPQDIFESICTENKLRLMLLENKVIFFDETSNEDENYYIIPSYLPRLKEDSADYLYLFDVQKPFITFKFEYFIPFGFINRLISEYGQFPDVKKYWKDMLLFTWKNSIKIFIKLDFESLQIKLYVIGNDKSNKKDIFNIKRVLFEDICMFYTEIDTYKTKLYEEEKSKNKLKTINDIQIPDDMYISLDDRNFVHYNTLDDSEKTLNSIASYELETNQINKENVKTISTRDFKNYTIKNKEINKMKKIFISYSRKDVDFRDELRKHLNMLATFDIADNWACEDITIGKWESQIQKELEDSDLIIYMLSVNFFSSPYILYEEVLKGMELVSKNPDKKILPVIVSDFVGLDKLSKKIENPNKLQEATLGLSHYQYLPYGNIYNKLTNQDEERIIPLKEYSNNNQLEEALTQIVTKISSEL